ncbi:kinase-like protein [Durotheca rogersii]|uniref:kinase-like protein n=1 Tax=Durotheca rogersii TaxID=419775 RepID=UPI00221F5F6D|nr:kinase-like protein [Durotheca rogersii]KAI5865309.1 kinase-like protein [Durotheca rogersii]
MELTSPFSKTWDSSPLASGDKIEYEYIPFDDRLENIQLYNPGGHHPVHLDDIIDVRFRVVHKLGNGGCGIVWLCRDITLGKWRAVKILTADYSSRGNEQRMIDHLRARCTPEELEQNHIAMPLDQFWLDGPNGRHLCLVMPILGSTVSEWREWQDDLKEQTTTDTRNVCRQIIKASSFMRSRGICHGDFRPGNILMKIEGDLDHLNDDQIYELMGEPQCYTINTESGEPAGLRAPEYSVAPVVTSWCEDMSAASIAVVDFGEAFLVDRPPKSTGIPDAYAAPELIFDRAGVSIENCDIWSLACTIYEVRTGSPLFDPILASGGCAVMKEVEIYIGMLPRAYATALAEMMTEIRGRSKRDADGPKPQPPQRERPRKEDLQPENTISEKVQRARERLVQGTEYSDPFEADLGRDKIYWGANGPEDEEPLQYRYSREEVLEFADLLRRMLRYDPDDRIKFDEILAHPWIWCRE